MSQTQIFLLVIIIIVAVILITTITVSIIVYSLIKKYINLNKVDKVALYNEYNNSVKNGSVVFLGDSLTEFYRTDEFLHDYQIYNRGIAGDTTDEVLNRLDNNVISINPSKIFLQIGTNDLNEKKDANYVKKNITKILTILREKLPTTKLFMISLYPINPKAFSAGRIIVGTRKNSVIMEINAYLKEYCLKENIVYIDVYPHLLNENGFLEKKYTVEGLHISNEGYDIITNIIKPYLD